MEAPSRRRPLRFSPPSGGRGGPSGAAPPPGRWPAMFFINPVVGHTQARRKPGERGSGKISSTNVDPLRMPRGLEPLSRRVVTPRPGASRDARGLEMNGSGPHRPDVVGIRLSLGGARIGTGSGRRGQAPKGTGGMPRRHQNSRRGRPRKVRGSCPTSVDPGIPAKTRGTETSQYPEERKSTETPSVAASERGSA